MTNHDQFDELLDHALGEYRNAEPLAGLEDRVLQRLRSQPAERRNPLWIWGAVAACAALVLIGVWIGVENSTTPHLPTAGKYGPPTAPPKEGGVGHPPEAKVGTRGSEELAHVTKRPTRPKEGRVGHPAPRGLKSARDNRSKGLNGRAEAVPLQNVASQFPTPAPLTAEEHALLALLHADPNVLPKLGDDANDMAIAPLEIKPLAGSAAPTQENSNE